MKLDKNSKKLKLAINIIISFGFAACFSYSTSPMYQQLESDQAIFVLIGRGMVEGYLPYKDLLENKGPLFFLLQAIPQLFLEGTIGIYILQSLLLTIESCLLDIMADMYKFSFKASQILKLFLFLPLLIIYTRGDKAEEYDLFFSIVCLFLFLKLIMTDGSENHRRILKYSFLYGLFIGAVIFIKMNDAAAPLTIFAFSFLYSMVKLRKLNKNIILYGAACIGLTLLGFGAAFFGSCIYYFKNNIFSDMIYGYIVLNFSMVYEGGIYTSFLNRFEMLFSCYGLFSMIPIFIIMFYFIVSKNKKNVYMALAFLVISIAAAGMTYTHTTGFLPHLIPAVIIWIMAGICILDQFNSERELARGGLFLIFFYCFIYLCSGLSSVSSLINTNMIWKQALETETDTLINYIPENDYDSVFILEKASSWYYKNHIYPAYRYLNLENFIRHMGNKVAEDFEKDLINSPVKWLIMPKELDGYTGILTNETIEYIQINYEFQDNIDNYNVYKYSY